MDASYRTLRAAADLGSFTVKALALTAGVSAVTVRTVLQRNSEYFEREVDPSDVPRQRGGQARAWAVRSDRRDTLEQYLLSTRSRLDRSGLAVTELSASGQLTVRSPSPSPELLTADELDKGLLMPEIQLLPKLMQRLLAVTNGLSTLTIRSGAGILVPGYDGIVQSPLGVAPYVPVGPSVWELGAGGNPRDKANRDLRERTESPLKVATKRTTFVFVTTRRLTNWTGGKHRGSWRDVVVIDAAALETWMLSQPAVHIWASEYVGLRPLEVSTVEHWFDIWRQQTDPPLPARLLGLGRESQAVRVREAALLPGKDVGVYANSRAEARAFIATALLDVEGLEVEDEFRLRSALLVATPNEWTRLVATLDTGILIPDFSDADVAAAVAKGLTVLVPMGLGDPRSRSDIDVPRIDRVRAAELLRAEAHKRDAGRGVVIAEEMSFQAAEQFAAAIDQSLTSFRRARGRSRTAERPRWASDPQISTWLAPLVLLGSWEPAVVGDEQVVMKLANRTYGDLERELTALAATEDPPFFKSGGAWRLAAPEDAFQQLSPLLTDDTKQCWSELALGVLGEYDPVLAVDLLDKVPETLPNRLTYSNSLRSGVARGAALLATFEEGN